MSETRRYQVVTDNLTILLIALPDPHQDVFIYSFHSEKTQIPSLASLNFLLSCDSRSGTMPFPNSEQCASENHATRSRTHKHGCYLNKGGRVHLPVAVRLSSECCAEPEKIISSFPSRIYASMTVATLSRIESSASTSRWTFWIPLIVTGFRSHSLAPRKPVLRKEA
jgi:hypothetical protein